MKTLMIVACPYRQSLLGGRSGDEQWLNRRNNRNKSG